MYMLCIGIIPACAGNTFNAISTSMKRRDHPRMRGEHGISQANTPARTGSSPHARGTHRPTYTLDPNHGIIPACAGNTVRALTRPTAAWDHPRMRGEHLCIIFFVLWLRDHPRMRGEHRKRGVTKSTGSGSSPHARGTHVDIRDEGLGNGIIPACAGNTRC